MKVGSSVVIGLGIAAWLLAAVSAYAGEGKPIVAVFGIQPRGVELAEDLRHSLTEYLGTALSESGAYRVVPPGDIRRALRAKARESHKRCYDKQCQIELGRELAANKTVSSSILKIGSPCVITCSIYDLQTQTAELSAKVEGGCSADELLASMREVARRLTEKREVEAVAGDRTEVAVRLEQASPYTSWGHVTFWSGLGLAALGSVSAYMAARLGDDATSQQSNSLHEESIAWEGAMWALLPAGGALMISGIVLWALPGDEEPGGLSGVSLTPGPKGGISLSLSGSF
jgi:hypothetical protein